MPRPLPLPLLALAVTAAAQTTTPAPGVTLMDPIAMTTGTLLDGAGQAVHTYTFAAPPGISSYLDRDGHVLRAYYTGPSIVGGGGALQRVAFDGTVLWDYTPPGPGIQHHDIEELPNGNVLLIVTDPYTQAQMAAFGRSAFITTPSWYSERIIEVQPTGPTTGNVVWEWRAIDHLVQDLDPTAPNFDVVANRPERLNANYPVTPASTLWMHMNGIDYNPALDQIVVSNRNWSEIWVIDHSTTTAEAAGSTGGNSGRGGDILYRWGNPAAYGRPGPQQLLQQHDANWIEPGRPGAGNLLIFNNKKGQLLNLGDASAVTEIVPPLNPNGTYALQAGLAYGPTAPVWEYMDPVPTNFYSGAVSSAERLPNGNTLVCSGTQQVGFELGLNDQVVWQVTLPNLTFKLRRYDLSLWTDAETISVTTGGTVPFHLVPGTPQAGDLYVVGGSLSGTSPGTILSGVTIPLNTDFYFLHAPGSSLLPGSIGVVGAAGVATAGFALPANSPPAFVGTLIHHAFIVVDNATFAIDHVSNARPLLLVP